HVRWVSTPKDVFADVPDPQGITVS
ncbi:signal peptidase I, partial [Burkholderia multivorans]